jgi:hypothetical protein
MPDDSANRLSGGDGNQIELEVPQDHLTGLYVNGFGIAATSNELFLDAWLLSPRDSRGTAAGSHQARLVIPWRLVSSLAEMLQQARGEPASDPAAADE